MYDAELEEARTNLTSMEAKFGVNQLSKYEYEGVHPLKKLNKDSKGVYGGYICGQALIVAMKTVHSDYKPHSLHSYFVNPGIEDVPFTYVVDILSDGKNFANRFIRVTQKGKLRFAIMISLTTKNSESRVNQIPDSGTKELEIFSYQSAAPTNFARHKPETLETVQLEENDSILHKLPPTFHNPSLDKAVASKPVAERDTGYWLKVSDDAPTDPAYRYAASAILSDSLHLASLSRLFQLSTPGEKLVSGGKGPHYFNVSLDHSIYFHDDNFNPFDWSYFKIVAPKFTNNRVLIEGTLFDSSGKLYATMVQEGLILFHKGRELKAKL